MKRFKAAYKFHGMYLYLHTNSNFFLDMFADFFSLLKKNERGSLDSTVNFYLDEVESINEEYFDKSCTGKCSFLSRYLSKEIGVIADSSKNIIRGELLSSYKLSANVIFDLVFLWPLCFFLRYSRICPMHASCVSKDNKGILIPGRVGSGKSTIAISLVRNNFKFLSDEYSLLRKKHSKIEALAFPLKVGLKDASIGLFPELIFLLKDSSQNGQKKRFFVEEVFPSCVINQCEPTILVFPQYKESGKTEVEPLSKKKALMHLMEDPNSFVFLDENSPWVSKQHFELLSLLAEQAKAYEFFYSDDNIQQIHAIINNL